MKAKPGPPLFHTGGFVAQPTTYSCIIHDHRETEEQKQQRIHNVNAKTVNLTKQIMAKLDAARLEELRKLVRYEEPTEEQKAAMLNDKIDFSKYILNKYTPLNQTAMADINQDQRTHNQQWTLTQANMLKQAVTRMETLEHELQKADNLIRQQTNEIRQLGHVQAINEKQIFEAEDRVEKEIQFRFSQLTSMQNELVALTTENEKLKATIKKMKQNRAR